MDSVIATRIVKAGLARIANGGVFIVVNVYAFKIAQSVRLVAIVKT